MSNKKDNEINSIIEGFNIFGSDTGGLINPKDLKEIMETMNMSEKNHFLYKIIDNFCNDPEVMEKGGIEAGDFIFKLEEELNDISSLEGLNKLFSVFSNPETNTIPITDFSEIAKNIPGEGENEQKLIKLISKSEIGNKELDFKKFREIVNLESGKDSKFIKSNKKINRNYARPEDRESSKNNNDNNDYKSKNKKCSNEENNYNNYMINSDDIYINNNNYFDSLNPFTFDNNSEMYNIINKKKLIIYDNNKYNINNEIKKEELISNDNDNDNNINYNLLDNPSENIQFEKINKINEEQKEYVNRPPYKKEQITNVEEAKEKEINQILEDEEINDKNQNKYFSYNYIEIEKNDDDTNIKNEQNISCRNKFTRGRMIFDEYNKDKYDFNISNKKKEEDEKNNNININSENNNKKAYKRYHRRYREMKSNTPDKKEEKKVTSYTGGNIDKTNYNTEKINSGYSKYRRKKKQLI